MSQFGEQLEDATTFLVRHREELQAISRLPGIDSLNLDFGLEIKDCLVYSNVLPHSFLRAASNAGISVELSHYPVSKDAGVSANHLTQPTD